MNDPISDYVTELAETLKGQRDATDLVAEMEDHLREAAESLILTGRGVTLAQEAAIMRLGDPQLVARALVASRARSLALPTRFTVAAGWLSWGVAPVWAVLTFLVSPAIVGGVGTDADLSAPWLMGLILLGVALLGVVVLGLAVRAGGRTDPRTIAAGLLVLLAFLGQAAFPWLLGLWGTLLLTTAVLLSARQAPRSRAGFWVAVVALQAALVVTALGLDSGLSERGAASIVALILTLTIVVLGLPATSWLGTGPVLIAAAWPLSTAVLLGFQAMQVGAPGYYGDYPMAWSMALMTGCLLTAVGCALIGRRLSAERPITSPQPSLLTTKRKALP